MQDGQDDNTVYEDIGKSVVAAANSISKKGRQPSEAMTAKQTLLVAARGLKSNLCRTRELLKCSRRSWAGAKSKRELLDSGTTAGPFERVLFKRGKGTVCEEWSKKATLFYQREQISRLVPHLRREYLVDDISNQRYKFFLLLALVIYNIYTFSNF